ncbi:hypothetical protein Tsubulata_048482 [Turnera subulata]|uniref:DUF4220 domain-containing protein n=1 Tax=Turnera subulata TaxID=218843 RepID=A0A9Q0JE35_9ROSI|nr:hypothetical protein Tsubulata_048482 [Turnera subulata]
MIDPIPDRLKRIYVQWNIRGAILFSLGLQIILVLFASFRKRTANKFMIFLLWSCYLLADTVAVFAIGHIASSQGNGDPSDPPDTGNLLVFWSPFLLLHLGGPDTFTAFALEDNELWVRHLLFLASQVIPALYLFILTFGGSSLILPTILLFVAGCIKYLERTYALYLASMDQFRESAHQKPDAWPNYANALIKEYSSKIESKLPAKIIIVSEYGKITYQRFIRTPASAKLTDIQVLKKAHPFFDIFKGLIGDLNISFQHRMESRDFFTKLLPDEALQVLEVELNFLYEALFTKAVVVHSKAGYVCRFVSSTAVVAGLAIFIFHVKKHGRYGNFDIGVTYALLFSALALDFIALLRSIFSNWTVVALTKSNYRESLPWWQSWAIRSRLKRWSKTIPVYNLIGYCLETRETWIRRVIHDTGLGGDFMDGILYVKRREFSMDLWKFIFQELMNKSRLAEDDLDTANKIYAARGNFILQEMEWDAYRDNLTPYITDVGYDVSLLIWHIATELLFNTNPNKPDLVDIESSLSSVSTRKKYCKIMSDYMLYLLIMQPTMMAASAGISKFRFLDTCKEAKRFFEGEGIRSAAAHEEACVKILEWNTDVPIQFVLFDASRLAKELNKLDEDQRWELLSKVWVELVSYAAGHCRAIAHAQQLSSGGELLTFVWLLMSHFGLTDKFQLPKSRIMPQLIFGK